MAWLNYDVDRNERSYILPFSHRHHNVVDDVDLNDVVVAWHQNKRSEISKTRRNRDESWEIFSRKLFRRLRFFLSLSCSLFLGSFYFLNDISTNSLHVPCVLQKVVHCTDKWMPTKRTRERRRERKRIKWCPMIARQK